MASDIKPMKESEYDFVAKLDGLCRATVPKPIRDVLDIQPGDYVKLGIIEVVKRVDRKEGVEIGEQKNPHEALCSA